MHLSEILVIYMAIAAPYGVASFLRQTSSESLMKRLVEVSGATLLWPLAWIWRICNNHNGCAFAVSAQDQIDEQDSTKIETAARKLLAALDDSRELTCLNDTEKNARLIYECRQIIETYVGLTQLADANSTAPSAREMEIARIGGRRGDDLLLAGLCIHRRNAARLAAHLRSAREQFVQSLTKAHDITHALSSASPDDPLKDQELSTRTLHVYGHAIDLASLLEDSETVLRIAHLLDAECARLRFLDTQAIKDVHHSSDIEESCLTTHVTRAASADRLPRTTFTQA